MLHFSRRRAGRSALEIWRRHRRQALREAWPFNLLAVALVAGCVLGIVYSEGSPELVWAGIIGAT